MGELTDSRDGALDAASEIRRELELHVAQCAAELERSGMPSVKAIAEAHRRFGNFDSHVEACRREAPEERMNRAMKIGVVAMTVVLLATVAYLGALVFMQRNALNEMKGFMSELLPEPLEVALAEARMAGVAPEASLGGEVAKQGSFAVDPVSGTEAAAFLRSAGIVLEDEFSLGMRVRIEPRFASSQRTLAWQRQGLPVRFEPDGAPSVTFPLDRSGSLPGRPIVTPGDRVFLERSDMAHRGLWSHELPRDARDPGAMEPPPSLDVVSQFRNVEQLAVSASVEVIVHDPSEARDGVAPQTAITGVLSYYADGTRWRMNSFLDPERFAGMQTDIAWDGAQFQYFRRDAGVLDVIAGPAPEASGLCLPNPLFELLCYLQPVPDPEGGRQTRFTDLKAKASTAALLAAAPNTLVERDRRTLSRTVFPGSMHQGRAYKHHVYSRPDRPGVPLEIERVDDQGTVITRSRFDGWDEYATPAGGTMLWPRSIRLEIMDPSGRTSIEMNFSIRSIDINDSAAVPANVFVIDPGEARVVVRDGTVVNP